MNQHKKACFLPFFYAAGAQSMTVSKRETAEDRSRIPAAHVRGGWSSAGSKRMSDAFPITFFEELGLVLLTDQLRRGLNMS